MDHFKLYVLGTIASLLYVSIYTLPHWIFTQSYESHNPHGRGDMAVQKCLAQSCQVSQKRVRCGIQVIWSYCLIKPLGIYGSFLANAKWRVLMLTAIPLQTFC